MTNEQLITELKKHPLDAEATFGAYKLTIDNVGYVPELNAVVVMIKQV